MKKEKYFDVNKKNKFKTKKSKIQKEVIPKVS